MAKKAKKEETVTLRSVVSKLMEKSMQSLISVAIQEAEHLITWIKNLSGLGVRIRRLLTTVILFSAGLGVLGIGVALYVDEMYPDLGPGVSHILVGLVIISVAIVHSKLNK